jgi:uncharacterized protein with HEPN domain
VSPERDWRFFLADMLEAADRILADMETLPRERFDAERSRRDSVQMNPIITGEAAKKIPDFVRQRFPGVDWRGMAGLRDVIAHSYYRVNPGITWDVAANKLPAARRLLDEVAAEYPFDPDEADFADG